jgi:hypothetical protein
VPTESRPDRAEVRAAELIAALCLATDLGTELPFEHGLQSTLVAMRLAERIGVDTETAVQTSRAVTNQLPHGRLVVLPAGHGPWLGQPEQTAAAVLDLVRGTRLGRKGEDRE